MLRSKNYFKYGLIVSENRFSVFAFNFKTFFPSCPYFQHGNFFQYLFNTYLINKNIKLAIFVNGNQFVTLKFVYLFLKPVSIFFLIKEVVSDVINTISILFHFAESVHYDITFTIII